MNTQVEKKETKIIQENKKRRGKETIQVSSNQFTPFRRAVCDWLSEEKTEKQMFVLAGDGKRGRGQGLRSLPVEGGAGPVGQAGRLAGWRWESVRGACG